MPESFSEVCENIKACLNSSKRQTALSELNRDYVSVLGSPIPFRALGYKSLDELIQKVPGIIIRRIGAEAFVDVKTDEKTAHIANLVRGQKASKPKKSSKNFKYGRSCRPAPPRPSYSSSYHSNNDARPFSRTETRTYRDSTRSYHRDNSNTRYNDSSRMPYQDSSRVPYQDSSRTSYESSRAPYHDYSRKNQNGDVNSAFNKYRSTRTSELNFSDNDSDELQDISDEYASATPRSESSIVDLTRDVDDLHITNSAGGTSRMVHIIDKNVKLAKDNLAENNNGHVPMNDHNIPVQDKLSSRELTSATEKNARKILSTKRGPAAIAAAGKELILTAKNDVNSVENHQPNAVLGDAIRPNSSSFTRSTKVDNLLYGDPPNSTRRIVIGGFMKNNARASALPSNRTAPATMPPYDIPPPVNYPLFPLTSNGNFSHSVQPRPPTMSTAVPPLMATAVPPPMSTVLPPSQNGHPFSMKMSEANMFKAGPNLPPDLSSKNSMCYKLLELTQKHRLPAPIYCNFNKQDFVKKTVSFMCKVKIGEQVYGHPFETSNLREVHEQVARVAYDKLREKLETLDDRALPVTQDRAVIISRIGEIVHPFPNGLISSKIEADYKQLHKELLPVNWLDIIKELSLLSVEQLVGGIVVYPAPEGSHTHSSVTILPSLILPESDHWDIVVSCCVSSNNFSFRIISEEYNARFVEFVEKMEEHYTRLREKNELHKVEMVKESNFYAAFLDNSWFRVKALANANIIEKNVKVSLIDLGDIDCIPKDSIFPLEEQFTNLPPQAIRAALSELEKYCQDKYVTNLLSEQMIEKTFVAKVDSRNPRLLLTLFDTSTAEDINLNEMILGHIRKQLMAPEIPRKDGLTDVFLSDVTEEGIATVQILSETLTFLKSLLDAANATLSEDPQKYAIKSTNELVGGIFLAKYALDNRWHRATVQKCESDDKIEVLFYDYNHTEIVSLKDIVDMQHFHQALGVIPSQAVEVNLVKPNSELFTKTIISFLLEIAYSSSTKEPSKIFVMKVVNEKDVPDVELYTRLNDSNKLLSINDIIGSYYPEYRGPTFSGIKISSAMLHPIKAYEFPEGIPFFVYVHMVANPSHFIIQPDELRCKLQQLMIDMNKFYSTEQPIVNIDEVKVGQAYAVKRDTDNLWCRGVILCIMDDTNSISVKLIDYGDIISVKCSQILQLLPCFRVLPSLAIKAELAGIEPILGDWNFQDCIRFKELVGNKVLVARLVTMKDDKASVVLVDRYDETKFIGSILAQEGRAVDRYANL